MYRLMLQPLMLILLLCSAGLSMACGPYSVAFYDFGALHYRDAKGRETGIDKDVVDALARRSGCQLLSTLESRARIWDQLSRGQLEITVSGVATPERMQLAEFWPYFRSRNHALMRKALAIQLPTPEAFLADTSRRVVVVRSFRHGPFFDAWLDSLRAQQRVEEVADFETALRVFRAGRVHLMLAHPLNLPSQNMPWLNDIARLDWGPQDDVMASLVVSRSRVSEADRRLLRETLRGLLRDGTVDSIITRHAGETLARSVRLSSPVALP